MTLLLTALTMTKVKSECWASRSKASQKNGNCLSASSTYHCFQAEGRSMRLFHNYRCVINTPLHLTILFPVSILRAILHITSRRRLVDRSKTHQTVSLLHSIQFTKQSSMLHRFSLFFSSPPSSSSLMNEINDLLRRQITSRLRCRLCRYSRDDE